jgi:hypothetical protein
VAATYLGVGPGIEQIIEQKCKSDPGVPESDHPSLLMERTLAR